jgi:hypothetical protein
MQSPPAGVNTMHDATKFVEAKTQPWRAALAEASPTRSRREPTAFELGTTLSLAPPAERANRAVRVAIMCAIAAASFATVWTVLGAV